MRAKGSGAWKRCRYGSSLIMGVSDSDAASVARAGPWKFYSFSFMPLCWVWLLVCIYGLVLIGVLDVDMYLLEDDFGRFRRSLGR